jgi:DNA-damage-inducible protein D
MKSGDTQATPYERIRQVDEYDNESWSARDLSQVLGCTEWRNFLHAIKKAQEACENSGYQVSDHFVDANRMVTLGSGARRKIQDFRLSRYACYLIVQNADSAQDFVALGQTYVAVQTRRQELADQDLLAGMSEDERRRFLRPQFASRQKALYAAAGQAGVVTSRDFANFQDHGYRGLYAGETARMVAARKVVTPATILDSMGSEVLAANLFRATQTEAKLGREPMVDKDHANQTHWEVGKKVRQTIAELGGTMPEDLPTPVESIQQLERKHKQAQQPHTLPLPLPEQGE